MSLDSSNKISNLKWLNVCYYFKRSWVNNKMEIKNTSINPRQLDYSSTMFFRGGFEIVYFSKLSSNISICLLPRHFILVIISWIALLASLAFYLKHIWNVHLMWFDTLYFMSLRLLYNMFVCCISKYYSVKFGEIDVFALRIVCQWDWIFIFSALTELGHFLVFMSIVIIWFGESICQIM